MWLAPPEEYSEPSQPEPPAPHPDLWQSPGNYWSVFPQFIILAQCRLLQRSILDHCNPSLRHNTRTFSNPGHSLVSVNNSRESPQFTVWSNISRANASSAVGSSRGVLRTIATRASGTTPGPLAIPGKSLVLVSNYRESPQFTVWSNISQANASSLVGFPREALRAITTQISGSTAGEVTIPGGTICTDRGLDQPPPDTCGHCQSRTATPCSDQNYSPTLDIGPLYPRLVCPEVHSRDDVSVHSPAVPK